MTWFWELEKRLITALLRSPSFHKGVQRVHRTVHQLQHGKPPENYQQEFTNLHTGEVPDRGVSRFFKLFWEELKTGGKSSGNPKK